MTFTSGTFLVFLAVVYSLYWRFHRDGQNRLILASSLLFYGWWDWRFLFLLLFTAGIDYPVGLALMKATDPRRRKSLLGLSLTANLGVLGFFKYLNFFAGSLHAGLARLGFQADPFTLQIILPVGISFYTFQAISYTVDVYRRRIPAVGDFVQYFAFITFFPHMIAGPIQQARHFLVQFDRDRRFDWDQSVDGIRQMLWGFFKKMVIADNLAPFVNAAYADPAQATSSHLLIATYFFAFQIYCDFSGYTDIAIGCARLFDLHMSRNFAYPYFSRSVPEFWRRWHITLSNWFRDYLYIPLGGSRVTAERRLFNVLVVFLVSGFWHGANWTFLLWGGLHGLFFIAYQLLAPNPRELAHSPPIPNPWNWRALAALLICFHLVLFAWIFFRADSVSHALMIVRKIIFIPVFGFDQTLANSYALALLILFLVVVEWISRGRPHPLHLNHWPRPFRWIAYYALVMAVLLFAPLDYAPFIYFQF